SSSRDNETSCTTTYTLSLHDALPIYGAMIFCAKKCAISGLRTSVSLGRVGWVERSETHQLRAEGRWVSLRSTHPTSCGGQVVAQDRKSTRLNSSHEWISYAVFCLKKK